MTGLFIELGSMSDDLNLCARQAIQSSNALGITVRFAFDGITMEVQPGSEVSKVIYWYQAQKAAA